MTFKFVKMFLHILRTTSHSIASGLFVAMVDETVFSGLRKDVQKQILKYLHTYSSVSFYSID